MTKKNNTQMTKNNAQNTQKHTKKPGMNPTGYRLMNRTVNGFSFLGILYNFGTLIVGLICIAIGVIIRSYDDVPLTVVDAKVSSVTWEGNDGCKSEEVTMDKGKKETQWKCDVVVTYKSDGSEIDEEYKFSNNGSRYTKNQSITLYRINADGTMTHNDPNAWKMTGWIALGVGVLITSSALFWLWICMYVSKKLCAAEQALHMFSDAFRTD